MMLLDPDYAIKVPEGVDPLAVALTEPFAVARHAVNATHQQGAAIVVGCGPVGLAIISCLVANMEVIVVGAMMGVDRIRPMLALGRELTLRFVLGYTDDEFAETLADIVSGTLDAQALIHNMITLDNLPAALPSIRSSPGKVLVTP